MSGRCQIVGMPLSTATALCPASTTAMFLLGTLITVASTNSECRNVPIGAPASSRLRA